MMKKICLIILSILAVVCMLCALTACGDSSSETSSYIKSVNSWYETDAEGNEVLVLDIVYFNDTTETIKIPAPKKLVEISLKDTRYPVSATAPELTLCALYADGSVEEITVTQAMIVGGAVDFSTVGTYTLDIEWHGKTLKTDIIVLDVEDVIIHNNVFDPIYGDMATPEIGCTVAYTDGTSSVVTLTEAMITEGAIDFTKPGVYAIKVTCGGKVFDKEITVREGMYIDGVFHGSVFSVNNLTLGGEIVLCGDITSELVQNIVIDKDTVLDLNGFTITIRGNYEFRVHADMIVKNGSIVCEESFGSYCFIVGTYTDDVDVAGNLTIENGTFCGNTSAVQVNNGVLTIVDGTFTINETGSYEYAFVINCLGDAYAAEIASVVITGGTFYKWNPEDNAAENPPANFVADGYVVVADGDYFKVVQAPVVAE